MKETTFESFLAEQLKDPEVKKEYDKLACLGCVHECKPFDYEPCCHCARQLNKAPRTDYYKLKGVENDI